MRSYAIRAFPNHPRARAPVGRATAMKYRERGREEEERKAKFIGNR